MTHGHSRHCPQPSSQHSPRQTLDLAKNPRNSGFMRMWGALRAIAWLGLAVALALVASLGSSATVHANPSWGWPLEAPHTVVRGFDRPAHNWLPGHRGMDLKAHIGQTVVAAGSGVVSFAGTIAGKQVVAITHGSLRTTYEPVKPSVAVGEHVRIGEALGVLAPGASHCATATTVRCLHWGLRRGSDYLNPLLLIYGRVRLLPIGSSR